MASAASALPAAAPAPAPAAAGGLPMKPHDDRAIAIRGFPPGVAAVCYGAVLSSMSGHGRILAHQLAMDQSAVFILFDKVEAAEAATAAGSAPLLRVLPVAAPLPEGTIRVERTKADPRTVVASSSTIVLKNLAYGTTVDSLRTFLNTLPVKPQSVDLHLQRRDDGAGSPGGLRGRGSPSLRGHGHGHGHGRPPTEAQFTGVAFAQYASADEARIVMQHVHGSAFGGRTVKAEYKRVRMPGAPGTGGAGIPPSPGLPAFSSPASAASAAAFIGSPLRDPMTSPSAAAAFALSGLHMTDAIPFLSLGSGGPAGGSVTTAAPPAAASASPFKGSASPALLAGRATAGVPAGLSLGSGATAATVAPAPAASAPSGAKAAPTTVFGSLAAMRPGAGAAPATRPVAAASTVAAPAPAPAAAAAAATAADPVAAFASAFTAAAAAVNAGGKPGVTVSSPGSHDPASSGSASTASPPPTSTVAAAAGAHSATSTGRTPRFSAAAKEFSPAMGGIAQPGFAPGDPTFSLAGTAPTLLSNPAMAATLLASLPPGVTPPADLTPDVAALVQSVASMSLSMMQALAGGAPSGSAPDISLAVEAAPAAATAAEADEAAAAHKPFGFVRGRSGTGDREVDLGEARRLGAAKAAAGGGGKERTRSRTSFDVPAGPAAAAAAATGVIPGLDGEAGVGSSGEEAETGKGKGRRASKTEPQQHAGSVTRGGGGGSSSSSSGNYTIKPGDGSTWRQREAARVAAGGAAASMPPPPSSGLPPRSPAMAAIVTGGGSGDGTAAVPPALTLSSGTDAAPPASTTSTSSAASSGGHGASKPSPSPGGAGFSGGGRDRAGSSTGTASTVVPIAASVPTISIAAMHHLRAAVVDSSGGATRYAKGPIVDGEGAGAGAGAAGDDAASGGPASLGFAARSRSGSRSVVAPRGRAFPAATSS